MISSAEPRAKTCGARRGQPKSPEHRAAISAGLRGKTLGPLALLTPEQRADYDLLKRNGYTRAQAFAALKVAVAP